MPKYHKYPTKRRDTAHRILFYISQRTSAKYPDWRDATIKFFWDLYELRDENPAIRLEVHKDDGLEVNHNATPVAYFQFRQRHILVHAARSYLIWSTQHRPFSKPHKGSWPLMWRCDDRGELDAFLRMLREVSVSDSLQTGDNP